MDERVLVHVPSIALGGGLFDIANVQFTAYSTVLNPSTGRAPPPSTDHSPSPSSAVFHRCPPPPLDSSHQSPSSSRSINIPAKRDSEEGCSV